MDTLMNLLGFSTRTELVSQLIREEFERRNGPLKFPGDLAKTKATPKGGGQMTA